MPVRSASAVWNGDLMTGNGTLKTETGAANGQYSFSTRFENGIGTNPEELIAAAHAACYSMALSAGLAKGGFKPVSISTSDKLHLDKLEAGFTITKIEINVEAKVEGIDEATFAKFAEDTKKGCPVSRALASSVEFILNAKLVI